MITFYWRGMIKLKTFTVLPDTLTEDTLIAGQLFLFTKECSAMHLYFYFQMFIYLIGRKHGHE